MDLKDKYKNFIEDVDFESLKDKIQNDELNINSPVTKTWAIHYMPNTSEDQLESFTEFLVNYNLIKLIIIDPSEIYEKIYRIIINKDTRFEDTIVVFKDNVIQSEKLAEIYSTEDLEMFSLKSYLDLKEIVLSQPKEKYDPLKFEETQKEIDRLMDKIEEKLKNNDSEIDKEQMAKVFTSGGFSINDLKRILGETIAEIEDETEDADSQE